jgi:Ser/Thr protein kinase RdoA (MazF antagonist)
LFSEERLGDYAVEDLALIQAMAGRINSHYTALDPTDLLVIHCDLWHDNIKLYQGVLAPFDFEDTILGYRLHDIAMALLDLAEDAGLDAYYDRLLPAFRSGYESLLPWPAGDLELLQMGRKLWVLNWFAQRLPKRMPEMAAFTADLFRRFEKTGQLTEPLKPQ